MHLRFSLKKCKTGKTAGQIVKKAETSKKRKQKLPVKESGNFENKKPANSEKIEKEFLEKGNVKLS